MPLHPPLCFRLGSAGVSRGPYRTLTAGPSVAPLLERPAVGKGVDVLQGLRLVQLILGLEKADEVPVRLGLHGGDALRLRLEVDARALQLLPVFLGELVLSGGARGPQPGR